MHESSASESNVQRNHSVWRRGAGQERHEQRHDPRHHRREVRRVFLLPAAYCSYALPLSRGRADLGRHDSCSDSATASITQELLFAGSEDGKLLAVKNLIRSGGLTPPALIFVQSIDRAKDLNKELVAQGVRSDVMHSERSKEERDQVVKRFAETDLWVLVCTDVMSRGVDFRGVELVIKCVRISLESGSLATCMH